MILEIFSLQLSSMTGVFLVKIIPFILLQCIGESTSAINKRIPSTGVIRQNICPDICRVTEKNKRCGEIRHLRELLNVTEICETYLVEKFSSISECNVRCKDCTMKVMTSRCSVRSLNKLYGMCKLKADTGPCKGYFIMYYYDYESGTCKKMVYGGCGGNKNRFTSEYYCLLRCGLLGILSPHPNSQQLRLAHQEL